MRARADSYIEPKKGKQHKADRQWNTKAHLFLSYKLWLPLARVTAVYLSNAALGSIWIQCRPRDGSLDTAKAICAYLNSSVGLYSILAGRDNRKPSYPQFSLDTLRSIPVPNLSAHVDARDTLARVFGHLRDEVLLPLPQMDHDPIRRRLDDAVTEALDLDPEWVATIRRELSREPSITNRRYAGLDDW